MKTVGIILSVVVVEVALLLIVVHSGMYNVACTAPEPSLLRGLFSATSSHSIRKHARGMAVPSLTDDSAIKEGFDHYHEMCVGCHGAPGVERSEIGMGLYPQGPNLAQSAKTLSPAELFWVVKNGIKSTGMPAFGPTHSDQKIWAVVAFLEKLPHMSPADYKAYAATAANEEKMDMDMSQHDH